MKTAAALLASVGLTQVSLGSAAPAVPSYASVQAHLTGFINMPMINATNAQYLPFETYFDTDAGKQYLSYYNKTDTYITRADLAMSYVVVPVITTLSCFETAGSTSVTNFFPDTTNYVFLGTGSINGQAVNQYQLITAQGAKNATYTLSVSAADNYTPVQFDFIGRDLIIGSHSDAYSFVYNGVTFGNGTWPANIFNAPAGFNCQPFQGSAEELVAGGTATVRSMIPQPGSGEVPAGALHPSQDPAFQAYLAKYGKSYSDEAELRARHIKWLQRSRMVDSHNRLARSQKRSLRLAVNHLADYNEGEIALLTGGGGAARSLAGAKQPIAPPLGSIGPADLSTLPASVNWTAQGMMEPVMDQGICGSCWVFGATAAVAGQYAIKYGQVNVFSKQEVVDCSWDFGVDGCDGGYDYAAYSWMMANGGIATRDQYGPYLSMDGFCKASQSPVTAKLQGYYNITGGEAGLMNSLANYGPTSVSVDADVETFLMYSSGVYDDAQCFSNPMDQDHTIIAAGYGTDPVTGLDYWIVRNHWSTYWGDNGYILIARRGNICGVTDAPTMPLVA